MKQKHDLWINERGFDRRRTFGLSFINTAMEFLEYFEKTDEDWYLLKKKIDLKTKMLGQVGKMGYKRLLNEINALQDELGARVEVALYDIGYIVDEMAEELISAEGASGEIIGWRKKPPEKVNEEDEAEEEKRKQEEEEELKREEEEYDV